MKSEKNSSALAGWRGNLISVCTCALLWGGCGPNESQPVQDAAVGDGTETSVDHDHHATDEQSSAITITGQPRAHIIGQFSVEQPWPIIPIATMLQPDGRVFAYGTNTDAAQGADQMYAIWNPVTNTITQKPNGTHSDVFCAGQALIPATGDTLMVGGDTSVNGVINYGLSDVNIFDYNNAGGVIGARAKMTYKRWYPTLVTLPNAHHLVLGGRDNADNTGKGAVGIPPTIETFAATPEVRAPSGEWRILNGATSNLAYGADGTASWNYPRAWVDPRGNVFIVNSDGYMFELDTVGAGKLKTLPGKIPGGLANLTAVMFEPGRILLARNKKVAVIVDINQETPVISTAGDGFLKYDRRYGNSTVLADGTVWFNGGSPNANEGGLEVFESELYDPATNQWKVMASAKKERLYHSTSMLLKDGTVFTGGGGAPGPYTQLNAEIYFPPYLFLKDGSGKMAFRPTLNAPAKVGYNKTFNITSNQNIKKVTLVRMGGATHNYNNETRFYVVAEPAIAATTVAVTSPGGPNVAPPGFYLLFAWNTQGVPSIGKIISINGAN